MTWSQMCCGRLADLLLRAKGPYLDVFSIFWYSLGTFIQVVGLSDERLVPPYSLCHTVNVILQRRS